MPNNIIENLVNTLEKRERSLRKQLGAAKRDENKENVKYYLGHIHEIESLLFILKEA